jgi:hypothetical protein
LPAGKPNPLPDEVTGARHIGITVALTEHANFAWSRLQKS